VLTKHTRDETDAPARSPSGLGRHRRQRAAATWCRACRREQHGSARSCLRSLRTRGCRTSSSSSPRAAGVSCRASTSWPLRDATAALRAVGVRSPARRTGADSRRIRASPGTTSGCSPASGGDRGASTSLGPGRCRACCRRAAVEEQLARSAPGRTGARSSRPARGRAGSLPARRGRRAASPGASTDGVFRNGSSRSTWRTDQGVASATRGAGGDRDDPAHRTSAAPSPRRHHRRRFVQFVGAVVPWRPARSTRRRPEDFCNVKPCRCTAPAQMSAMSSRTRRWTRRWRPCDEPDAAGTRRRARRPVGRAGARPGPPLRSRPSLAHARVSVPTRALARADTRAARHRNVSPKQFGGIAPRCSTDRDAGRFYVAVISSCHRVGATRGSITCPS
jgi:hypothetical protein